MIHRIVIFLKCLVQGKGKLSGGRHLFTLGPPFNLLAAVTVTV